MSGVADVDESGRVVETCSSCGKGMDEPWIRDLHEGCCEVCAPPHGRPEYVSLNTSKESHMPTVTSILSLPERGTTHMVRYRSNADCGYTEEFFDWTDDAAARVRELRENPPGGDHFHPAPKSDLDIRLFRIERAEG